MKNKISKSLLIILSCFVSFSCSSDPKGKVLNAAKTKLISSIRPQEAVAKVPWRNTERNIYIIPSKTFFSKGNILLLHGWNLKPMGWCEQTMLCEKLRESGYNIVVPDMGKSMYASQTFPETLPTMAEQPQLSWIADTVIAYLCDTFKLISPNTNNIIVGLSTGARGSFALGLELPYLFRAVVALSGDYDQTLMPNDNLMTYFYGSYEDFPERWEGSDNLLRNADKWELPIYIGHAIDDRVVPWQQSDTLNKILLKIGKIKPITHFPKKYGHDYKYWDSESENIISFIKNICENNLAEK